MPDPIEPSELQPNELLQRFAQFLESNDIAYRVVGSMASLASEWSLVKQRVAESQSFAKS